MEEFMFVVPGNPVPKRGAIVTRNGTFLDSKTTKALKDQRAFFTYEMLKRKLKPIDKAVVVYLAYYKLLPQSKKVGALAVTRPDLDNYVKLTLDVIKETVLVDDNLVIKLVASKFYCTANPRTEVRVELV